MLSKKVISFTAAMKTHTIILKVDDYIKMEKPIVGDFSDPLKDFDIKNDVKHELFN